MVYFLLFYAEVISSRAYILRNIFMIALVACGNLRILQKLNLEQNNYPE